MPWPCVRLCPSVCSSQVGVLSKRMNESGCFFGTGASFDLCTLHYKSSSKNKGTSHRNFVSNSGLRKFRHGKCRVFSKNSSTFDLVHYTYDGRRDAYVTGTHIDYYTSVDCNSLRYFDLLYSLFLHCCAVVIQITTDTARRSIRAFCRSSFEARCTQ